MRWEEASQRTILEVCKAAGINGALLTNVVFVPVAQGERDRDRSYAAQLDHVLVFESGHVLVIENKRWNGIVFDGRKPSAVHHAFRNLLDESSLTGSFAIQVRSRRVLDHADDVEHCGRSACSPVGTPRPVRSASRPDACSGSWPTRTATGRSGSTRACSTPATPLRTSTRRTAARARHRPDVRRRPAVVTNDNELRGLVTDLARKHAVPNRARTDAVVRQLAGQGAHTRSPSGTYRLPQA